jgi:hypothetical protein
MKMFDLMLIIKICLEWEKSDWSVFEPRLLPAMLQISSNIDKYQLMFLKSSKPLLHTDFSPFLSFIHRHFSNNLFLLYYENV